MSISVESIHTSFSGLQPEFVVPLRRIGRKNDGGYVISETALANAQFLFSGGYGNDFSFEKDFLRKSNAKKVVLYDYSITFFNLIFNLIETFFAVLFRKNHYSMSYHFKNLLTYFILKVTPRISLIHLKLSSRPEDSTAKVSDLKTAFKKISESDTDQFFCKLDIEGYEYELIQDLGTLEKNVSGLVIEFHDTYARRETFIEGLRELKKNYAVVHTHVNNYGGFSPDGEAIVYEVSLLNRRYAKELNLVPKPRVSLVEEDQPNNPNSPEVELLFK